MTAPVGAVTIISPLELVRTKMQSRRRPYREMLACIRWAVAQHGMLSLWRGWGPTVLRDVPFSGENTSPQGPQLTSRPFNLPMFGSVLLVQL